MSGIRQTYAAQGDHAAPIDMDRIACYRAISTRDARFDGRLFVGVKTTGIYCRPICPVRTPKFENVSFYAWRPWRAYAAQHRWAAGAARPTVEEKADAREAA